MSNLKNAIKRIESGILYTGLGGVNHEDVRAIIAAAKSTLPKTVKKWTVECDYTYPTEGKVVHYRHGGERAWAPYGTREKAAKFAASLLSEAAGYSNVSVVEVEVEDS